LHDKDVPKVRQLFVTKSRLLAEKVEEYFAKLLTSLSAASKSPEELKALAAAQKILPEGEALVDKDDELRYRSDLPAKFSHLTDQHFPLFITFDHVSCFLQVVSNHGHVRCFWFSFANFLKLMSWEMLYNVQTGILSLPVSSCDLTGRVFPRQRA
jgi:hypothetical protein